MSENILIIKDFKPDFNADSILAKLPEQADRKRVEGMAAEAAAICNASGIAILSQVTVGQEHEIRIDNIEFKNPLLHEKISGLGRVFPYLSTEGKELAKWGAGFTQAQDKAIAHLIRQSAVKGAESKIEETLCSQYDIPVLSSMNPGSLPIWPLSEQKKMFALLDPLPGELGVSLLDSMLMNPDYSVSGIFFQTGKKFYNCQLCPNDGCPNRKAPRDI